MCRSWQREIEMVSFEKLVIKYADISELDKIVVGARRTYLKHVLLSVELETYSNRLRMTPGAHTYLLPPSVVLVKTSFP